jgi:hypothetical protein
MNLDPVRFPFSREAVERTAAARLELVPAPADSDKAMSGP